MTGSRDERIEEFLFRIREVPEEQRARERARIVLIGARVGGGLGGAAVDGLGRRIGVGAGGGGGG